MLVVSMSSDKTNPWEKFNSFMQDKTDFIQRIPIEEENEEAAVTNDLIMIQKEEQKLSTKLDEEIETADKVRNIKFTNDKPTYSYTIPSEKRGDKQEDNHEKLNIA
ncbi:MAG: hypothetical protein WBJ13_01970 [Sedimentibacter sp.]